ncbi:MAG: phosphohistidine phosphatase SixA, partial [Candidatus Marinimicrobia bacterium CG_4_10_14_0_2_um_filter_48_9]
MRHGYAESPSYRSDDFFRALTIEGNQLAYKAARGLLTIIPHLDRIVTSPIKRARQTAEIFGEVYQF